MKCPHCGNINTRVIDTRSRCNNLVTYRSRKCFNCHDTFATYEFVCTKQKYDPKRTLLISKLPIPDLHYNAFKGILNSVEKITNKINFIRR